MKLPKPRKPKSGEFVILDSPQSLLTLEAIQAGGATTGALKFDNEKPRMELLPTQPLLGVARVLTFGAKKYAAHNWRQGFDYSRLIGAAYRHLSAYNDGEDIDPESGESHIDHALCTLMFLSEQIAKGTGKDDRFKAAG